MCKDERLMLGNVELRRGLHDAEDGSEANAGRSEKSSDE